MSPVVHIQRHPNGPRVYVAGQRLHHGATGCLLVAIGRRHRALMLAALALVAHDRNDWRVWFAREKLAQKQG